MPKLRVRNDPVSNPVSVALAKMLAAGDVPSTAVPPNVKVYSQQERDEWERQNTTPLPTVDLNRLAYHRRQRQIEARVTEIAARKAAKKPT